MSLTMADSTSRVRDPNGAAPPGAMTERTAKQLLLAVLLLIPAGWIAWVSATSNPSVDFFTFWSVSRVVSTAHIGHIYSPDAQRQMALLAINEARSPTASNVQRQAAEIVTQHYDGRIDSTGTPFLYTVIAAISSGRYAADQKRFVLLCFGCLVLSMLLLKNILRFSWLELSLLLVFVATDYGPVLSDVRVGNVNEIQLLAIVLFIFFMARNQPLLSGVAIGVATVFKPTTIFVVLLAIIAGIVDRQYRQLARLFWGCTIAAGASFLLSVAYFGTPAPWMEFLGSLRNTLNGVTYSIQFGNFSLSALLFGATRAGSFAIPVILIGAFSWLLFATRRSEIEESDVADGFATRRMHTAFAVGGGGCAIMLLSSPLVWLHYYLLLLPLSLYVIRVPPNDSRGVFASHIRIRGIAALALPFVLFFAFSFLTQVITGTSAFMMCVLTVSATLATLGLASYYIWQGRAQLRF